MSITHRIVEKFAACFSTNMMEVGILDQRDRMLIRKCPPERLARLVPWLQYQNSNGAHIYARPVAPHAYTLLDDLTPDRMKRVQLIKPTLIMETSPSNYQAWLHHPRELQPALSTCLARYLADAYDADPGSADFRHFGRLPGFTNRKPKYRRNGLFPFVTLTASAPLVRSPTSGLINDCSEAMIAEAARVKARQRRRTTAPGWSPGNGLDIARFHQNPLYQGDLHRADYAYALAAAARGEEFQQIADVIFGARDLTHKGNADRQHEYARRTAEKAIRVVGET